MPLKTAPFLVRVLTSTRLPALRDTKYETRLKTFATGNVKTELATKGYTKGWNETVDATKRGHNSFERCCSDMRKYWTTVQMIPALSHNSTVWLLLHHDFYPLAGAWVCESSLVAASHHS